MTDSAPPTDAADATSEAHPVNQLNDVVQQRYRFGIMAFLSSVERADFTTVRDALGVTDGNLNRHLKVLADHGLVDLTKPVAGGRRTRTWLRLTPGGRAALDDHVRALEAVLATIG